MVGEEVEVLKASEVEEEARGQFTGEGGLSYGDVGEVREGAQATSNFNGVRAQTVDLQSFQTGERTSRRDEGSTEALPEG